MVGIGASTVVCTGARDGAMAQIEVLSSPERRRRWSAEQKRSIVAEAFAPGASVCEVARRADVVPSLIYRWRHPCDPNATFRIRLPGKERFEHAKRHDIALHGLRPHR